MAYRDQLLPVKDGGTGAGTLTGVCIGNGTSAITATATPSVTSITINGGTPLGDYVESTFTPSIALGGGTTGITYSGQSGKYTRIGNIVQIQISILLTSKGTDTGALTITGLPITVGSVSTYAELRVVFTAVTDYLVAEFTTATTTATIYDVVNGGASVQLDDTSIADNSQFNITGFYFA